MSLGKLISPAAAGASPGTGPGAGEELGTRPRSGAGHRPGATLLEQINASTDTAWLKAVMGSQDYQVSIRSAAQRRLAALFRKQKRR